jgi:hypothetical protein
MIGVGLLHTSLANCDVPVDVPVLQEGVEK